MQGMILSNRVPHAVEKTPERFHGVQLIRGLEDVPRSPLYEGRFGRMFRHLAPFAPNDNDLVALAATMIETEVQADDTNLDNPKIPAGFTYLGQFIDHDITFDPASKLQRDNDPDALRNFRTPRFDLDSLYGGGPDNSPYLYSDGIRLLIGKNADGEDDLPRNSADPRRALIGDPRNDENAIVSQLHLAFIKFHNQVVEELTTNGVPREMLFEQAAQTVRWHYQWVVVHDFLRRIVGQDVIDDILKFDTYKVPFGSGAADVQGALNVDLKFYKYRNQPFMPVEFSVAAYRFGHSMVRTDYELNEATEDPNDRPIFSDTEPDLRGFQERAAGLEIEWARFFDFPNCPSAQRARKIDTLLATGLSTLPQNVTNELPSTPIGHLLNQLALRNLLRGKALGLPSGQAVARAMGMTKGNIILTSDELELPPDLVSAFGENTPLWYYILKEAQVRCGGERLGPVGGRIVAEVLLGLLDGDPTSYLGVEPTWQPTEGEFGAPADGEYSMTDLLTFAGVKTCDTSGEGDGPTQAANPG